MFAVNHGQYKQTTIERMRNKYSDPLADWQCLEKHVYEVDLFNHNYEHLHAANTHQTASSQNSQDVDITTTATITTKSPPSTTFDTTSRTSTSRMNTTLSTRPAGKLEK